MTPDGLPIVGKPQSFDNLVIASGHNMNGIMYGPITGKLVAEIIGSRSPSVTSTRSASSVSPECANCFA